MANPAIVQGMQVTLKTLCNGQTFYNVIKHSSTIVGAYTTPTIFALAWIADVIPLWADCLATSAVISQIKVEAFAPAGVPAFPPYFSPLSVPGTVAGDVLPPYVSARVYKTVDPEESFPTDPPTPWRYGMVRISGIPESSQVNGFLTEAALDDLQLVADALYGFEAASFAWQMHIDRFQDGNWYWGVIGSVTAGYMLGSQNTRKY